MKTSRQKVMDVFNRKGSGEGVMWTGNPDPEVVAAASRKYGIENSAEALFQFYDDDCRWIGADSGYHNPQRQYMFDTMHGLPAKMSHGTAGCFGDCEDVSEVENHPWPDAKDCDFTEVYRQIEQFPDKMVFTGMWGCFFHVVMDYFGLENYFIKMYDEPELVEAMTERIVDFYVEANDKFLSGIGDRADVVFFGNDLGTQLDLFMSPELFRKFILPSLKRLIDITKKYNKKAMMHSCGAISRIIPDLIDAGIDILHPIQAQAAGMSADDLKQYKNDIAFVGGIDAQSFFVNATPEEIRQEVKRVKSILGPNIVLSPSHETILPNVPPENILAMAQAAKEDL